MSTRKVVVGALFALVALVAMVVASSSPAKPAKPAQGATSKAAVVTDIGGLGDKGFNDLCKKGGDTAAKQLGIGSRVFISKSAADYIPNPEFRTS